MIDTGDYEAEHIAKRPAQPTKESSGAMAGQQSKPLLLPAYRAVSPVTIGQSIVHDIVGIVLL